jgi:hypothetical protein
MTYATQLRQGKKVEREHLPFYRQIKRSGKCPSPEKFTEGIAKAHIQEDKKYYTKLKKAGL